MNNLHTPTFINAIAHLRSTLKKEHLIFQTEVTEIGDLSHIKLEPQVHLKNATIEGNLRMIESYMPEILFMIALECDSEWSIHRAIISLSKKGFLYAGKKFARMLLQIKMRHFFEAIFFAEIFSEVWHGKWENRCFVIKDVGGLQYYDMLNIHDLIDRLLEKLTFSIKHVDDCHEIGLKIMK